MDEKNIIKHFKEKKIKLSNQALEFLKMLDLDLEEFTTWWHDNRAIVSGGEVFAYLTDKAKGYKSGMKPEKEAMAIAHEHVEGAN